MVLLQPVFFRTATKPVSIFRDDAVQQDESVHLHGDLAIRAASERGCVEPRKAGGNVAAAVPDGVAVAGDRGGKMLCAYAAGGDAVLNDGTVANVAAAVWGSRVAGFGNGVVAEFRGVAVGTGCGIAGVDVSTGLVEVSDPGGSVCAVLAADDAGSARGGIEQSS